MINNTIYGRGWRRIFIFLIIFIPAAIVNTNVVATDDSDQPGNKKQDVIYACPMHPEVSSYAPGKCSICGMFLVAQDTSGRVHADHDHAAEGEEKDAENLVYACPMHPDETSHSPGKCSICGMFLVAEHMGDDGNQKSGGLACTCLGPAAGVLAGQGAWKNFRLDGCTIFET